MSYQYDTIICDRQHAFDPVGLNEDEAFEIEEILDFRLSYNVKQWRIRWKGYDKNADTWEPITNLVSAEAIAVKCS